MRKILVAGIGTDVGKTVVSAILTLLLDGDYWKPIQCGTEENSDTATLKKWIDPSRHAIHPPAYSLQAPLSPHHAARLENRSIQLDTISLPETDRFLIIEGVGGIFVPLTTKISSLSLFKSWNCEWIIVSRHYLGSINHTLLTLEALKHCQIPTLGIIFNGEPNLDSEEAILEISQVPLLGRLLPEPSITQKTLQKYAKEWKPSFSKFLSLTEKDRACVWHPFTQSQTAHPPIPIIQAKGVYLYAEDGRRYLDAISSWWVNLHGHAHPYIAQKINSQAEVLEQVVFAGFTHAPAVELASRLLSILPNAMSKVFYSDNGSTSVEVALKIALQFWHNQNIPKTKIICFKNSYHGDTFGAMSAAGRNEFNRPFWTYLFDVDAIDPPLRGHEDSSLSQLKSILDQEEAACLIFEPLILGSGGMMIYPPHGLDRLISCCKQHQVLTIADEVMTGFGRTGTLFACDQLQEEPDLICLSKGLTGGFLPLGVTACTEKIFNGFLGDHLHQAFLHGHSYTANPLACCSALASLDLLLENSCFLQRKNIEASHWAFCQKWQSHPKLKRCETIGTILALEYQANTHSYFDSLSTRLYDFFLDKGILVRPLGNVLYLLPPYCIQSDELHFIYDQMALTLEGDL